MYGVSGTVTYTVEGQAHDIGPGDALFIPRGEVHGFETAAAPRPPAFAC